MESSESDVRLGDLEFKLDDYHDDMVVEGRGGPYVSLAATNRILAEKLERALKVYCRHDDVFRDKTKFLWAADESPTFAGITHTARLVCIEEIPK